MKKRIVFLTLLLTLTLFTASASRGESLSLLIQSAGGIVGRSPQTGMVNFIGAGSGGGFAPGTGRDTVSIPADQAALHLETFAPLFGENDPRRNLQLVSNSRDRRGQKTFRFQQSYQGIPVIAGELILNMTADGSLLSLSGELSPSLDHSTMPIISEKEALQKVLDLFALSYQIEEERIEVLAPQLWIFDERLLAPSDRPAELVWRIEARVPSLPINELVLVNAENGAISLHFNQADTSWAEQGDSQEAIRSKIKNQSPAEKDFMGIIPNYVEPALPETTALSQTTFVHSISPSNTWYVSTTGNDFNDCLSPGASCESINGALNKPGFLPGDQVLVAEGVYTGSGDRVDPVIYLDKDASLSGGWNTNFTHQDGYSTIDGELTRGGLENLHNSESIYTINLEKFIFINGFSGYNYANIYLKDAVGTIENCFIRDGIGVGVVLYRSVMSMNYVEISNHSGHGIEIRPNGEEDLFTISNSLIYQNQGSGIYTIDANLLIENTTISGNGTKEIDGGGIHYTESEPAVSMTLNNVTITANTGDTGGGLYLRGTAYLQNSIIMNNSAWLRSTSDCFGGPLSNGHNFIGNTIGCDFVPGIGDHINEFIYLTPLADFGGITRTHALTADSPAIDAGSGDLPGSSDQSCAAADQRDALRPVDGDSDTFAKCDPGAYEHQGAENTASFLFALNRQKMILRTEEAIPNAFEVLVLGSNGGEVAGIPVTFSAPESGPGGIFTANGTNTITVITDISGHSSSGEFITNSDHGEYLVEADAAVIPHPIFYQVNNTRADIATYEMKQRGDDYLPGNFLCDELTILCTDGINPDADTAHQFAEDTYLFFLDQHNRDSLDGMGMQIISSVQYLFDYSNAVWNGSQVMYGEGSNHAQVDDVAAHELTHGFTQHTSGLFNYYQSGAINESFSDIWGEVIDQRNGYGSDDVSDDWLLGEDLESGAIRSMQDPTLFGHPDKMSSPNYHLGDLENLNEVDYDNGGIHTNSGVNNKAVYLMVSGGNFNGYTITGIGWDKVLAIYYLVQTTQLTSGADYSILYHSVLQACLTLIGGSEGITSADCVEVTNALNAVEMDSQPQFGFNPDSEICPAGHTIQNQFSDSFENGTSQWAFASTNSSTWTLSTGYATEGTSMLSLQDFGSKTDIEAAITDFLQIPIIGQQYLFFNHSFRFNFSHDLDNLRTYWDGGVLQYQIEGERWQDAGSMFHSGQNLNGSISTTSDSALSGEPAFVADSHGYVATRYDISSLAGDSVRFRWVASTDSFVTGAAWYLDEVRVYSCIAPAPAFPPTSFSASDGEYNSFVALNWDAVPDAEEYNIYRDLDPAGNTISYLGTTPALSFNDTDVADMTPYTYWVEACNFSGCSALSAPNNGYADSSITGMLFSDNFETGDFSLWTRVNDGNGYLYPCSAAANDGDWGACVDRGTDKRKQLIDETPVVQTVLNVRFVFDINSLSMGVGERFRFIQVKMGPHRPFLIVLKYQGGQYLIQLNTLVDDLTKVKTDWYPLSDEDHTIEVNWQAASTTGANNGLIKLFLDGGLLEELTGLDNDTIYVDTCKIGFTSRLDGKNIAGIFYLDDVATSNGGYIGLP